MTRYESADACWARLDGRKQPLMRRVENYASLTIPKVCLPLGFQPETTDQTHDYQSIGAQATNNVVNKLMLALFRPSAPFFRADLGDKAKKQAAQNGQDELPISDILASLERQASAKLDQLHQRPKLYTVMRHLVIAGNVLLCLEKDTMRVMGLRYWNAKRTVDGRLHTLIIREHVKFDELDQKVRLAVVPKQPDSEVSFYKHITLNSSGQGYTMSQWVDGQRLPPEFDGRWSDEKRFPYRVLVWDLADESDYGTGLVEEYAGDLEAASVLSEAMVNGGVLAAEFRWLVNPTGMTDADDFNNSKNGDALAGRPEDVQPTNPNNSQSIQVLAEVLDRYEKRISRGFLMATSVQRNAERVTAEEIRLLATELESSFGGVYSTLAAGIQTPIAWWLLSQVDTTALKADLTLTIITGLDALSRNSDLESLRLALQDLAEVSNVPPLLQERINWDAIATFVGNGRGVNLKPFLLSEAAVQENRKQAMAMQVQAQNQVAAGKSAADAMNQPQG